MIKLQEIEKDKTIDLKENKSLISFLNRVGYITIEQFKALFPKESYYVKGINMSKIIDISISTNDNMNYNIFKGKTILYTNKLFTTKILHNLYVIQSYIALKNRLNFNLLGTFFDFDIKLNIKKDFTDIQSFFAPDILFIRDNNYYCIEIDLGTEKTNALETKENNYLSFIRNNPLLNVKIFFIASRKRVESIKRIGLFQSIPLTFLILK